ncbi:MAG: Lhr family helicase, partial [Vicinamibacterales bacterium]
VYARRAGEPSGAADLGRLDPAAIERVRDEARPDPRDADELHDALLTAGFLTKDEARPLAPELMRILLRASRATTFGTGNPEGGLLVAAERLPELRAVHPGAVLEPSIEPPASRTARVWTRDQAIVELLRGRVAIAGPTTARGLADALEIETSDAEAALLALESEGVVLRGFFSTPEARIAGTGNDGHSTVEWCDRRLLARIHRYTLHRLRAEIEPVSPADFMRFLFNWQHVAPSSRLTGIDGLRAVLESLDGFELAADAWERAVLPDRVDDYHGSMLDTLCLTGEAGWARLSSSSRDAAQLVGATPVALFLREHAEAWTALNRGAQTSAREPDESLHDRRDDLDANTRIVFDALRTRGASFIPDLVGACGLDEPGVRRSLAELVAAGVVASDGFGGLRIIVRASSGRPGSTASRASVAGRWSIVNSAGLLRDLTGRGSARDDERKRAYEAAVVLQATTLLRRYGIVFRRLLSREANLAPWRELTRVYRRLEARGEIRGGRFVSGMSGEQFAAGEAIERLREVRRTPPDGRCLVISAADPLNLSGIITSGDRVRAATSTRIAYRDGVPMAALEGDYVRPLIELSGVAPGIAAQVATTLTGRTVLSGFVGRP